MNPGEVLCRDEVYRIVGAAMEVLNELGHGLHEKPSENALVVEFGLAGIAYEQQRRFPVRYKSVLERVVLSAPFRNSRPFASLRG